MTEITDIVDEQDNVIGSMPRAEVRKKKLLHRSVIILLFNSKGQIFVHQRTTTKDIFPGLHDMTIGGGVKAGESYEEAAIRELKEEAGIVAELMFLFPYQHQSGQDNYLAKVFRCISDGPVKIQKEEIAHGEFMSIEELKKLMGKEEFCPDSKEIFKEFEKNFL